MRDEILAGSEARDADQIDPRVAARSVPAGPPPLLAANGDLVDEVLLRREAIALKPRVAAGLAVGESLHLKLPFEGPKGADDTENMWIDVQRWEGARVEGVLLNTPRVALGLVLGSRVTVQESAILDYLFTDADGNERGDLTKTFAKPAASR